MVRNKKALLAAIAATTLLTSSAVWAASPENSDQQKPMPQTTAEKDFGKLSHDGTRAFQDLTLTRIAIFDGRIDDAKKFVGEADKEFGKAKTDETVFTKAETDLKSAHSQSYQVENTGQSADATKGAESAAQMKKPIAWLPVNGAITINEDYTANPAKTAAVADANKSLKNGDHKGAMEKLKLADMDVDITLAVVPLEQTINDVHKAAELINSGKYYEGSQVLRQIQDSERFDVAGISDTPKVAATSAAPSSKHPAEAVEQNAPAAKH